MPRMWSRRPFIITVMFYSLLALSACQSGDVGSAPAVTAVANTPAVVPTTSSAAVTPAVTQTSSTPVPAPAASAGVVTPSVPQTGITPIFTPAIGTPAAITGNLSVEMVFGTGAFILPETKVGLSDLSSYKAALALSFDGTRDGKTQRWSKTYVMLSAKNPAVRQLTIENTGDIPDFNPVFSAEVDGAAFEQRGNNACTATAVRPGDSFAARLEPAGFLSGVIGAERAASDTVNGIAANQYTFDERAFGQLGVAKSTGELWVAAAGGYIVRYKVTTKGTALYFGEGIEGTLTWDYELTGVNQPVAVELPKGCPAGMVDAPLLPGATAVRRVPGLLSYSTSTSLAAAAAFYQKQIPLLGWKLTGDPNVTATLVLLDYTQGAKTMTVLVSVGQNGTNVRIVVGTGQH